MLAASSHCCVRVVCELHVHDSAQLQQAEHGGFLPLTLPMGVDLRLRSQIRGITGLHLCSQNRTFYDINRYISPLLMGVDLRLRSQIRGLPDCMCALRIVRFII